jgi:hypothetical protein
MTESELERFMLRVVEFPNGGCWIWVGAYQTTGYGRWTTQRAKHRYAHRVAYEMYRGPIPDGLCVLHNCPGGDNPACVNPEHMFLGTRAENQADMAHKGRSIRGEKRPNAKLTAADVMEVRAGLANGTPSRELAARFGVTRGTINDVGRRYSWKHLGDLPNV